MGKTGLEADGEVQKDTRAVSEDSGADGRHVVLIEDDALNARIIRKILEQEGHTVSWFESGELFFAESGGLACDLILLDVVLPGIDGFEVCRRLKESNENAEIPVIFITARHEPDDVVTGFEAGGADYIPKPFRPRETLARVRTHLQLRALHASQAKMISELDAAVHSRNRLLGVTAHDLRNPMISIQGFAEMLRDEAAGKVNGDQKEMASCIASAATSMLELINDMLDLSAIETGELKLSIRENDLGKLMNRASFLYRSQAERKGIQIDLNGSSEPVIAAFDEGRIRQVAENLIGNAIKFSPPNTKVAVDWGVRDGGIAFSVSDEGPGIPEAERGRLFRDYGKTSVLPTGGEASTGLGLAICRKIVDAHGGAIQVNNLPAKGCRFEVAIPAPDLGRKGEEG